MACRLGPKSDERLYVIAFLSQFLYVESLVNRCDLAQAWSGPRTAPRMTMGCGAGTAARTREGAGIAKTLTKGRDGVGWGVIETESIKLPIKPRQSARIWKIPIEPEAAYFPAEHLVQ